MSSAYHLPLFTIVVIYHRAYIDIKIVFESIIKMLIHHHTCHIYSATLSIGQNIYISEELRELLIFLALNNMHKKLNISLFVC